ncbi:NERD domain-containing protein [Haloimpatiens sp. FM7330]|uniref:NERD domain-containing protein n=1 Tax=Haloimpatiens sp. FM7330 TaxID=3298610 RepID=UPI00363FB6A1
MSFIGKALSNMINGKRTITKPTFLKEFTKENNQLNDLLKLSKKVIGNKKELIDRDITFIRKGLDGEKNVYFELKNSFIPMLCLYDIRLEYNDYTAQFDFILITNKAIFVLETKKLNGDIEITSDGDFIRTIRTNSGKFIKKEGMYSPISQNERHINILREILLKEGLIKDYPIKSIVVIANPKTIINKSRCPESIRNNIYKYDQLVNLLKNELNDKNNQKNVLEKYMYNIANFLIEHNKPKTFNYQAKYMLTAKDLKNNKFIKEKVAAKDIEKPKSNFSTNVHNKEVEQASASSETYQSLKKYRLDTSRKEGIKPYMIFNNKELDSLIENKPQTKDALLQIKGFGPKKVEKYGDAILSIIQLSQVKNNRCGK